MRTQLACLSVLLAGLMMSSSGCVVLAVGAGAAGTVAYVEGDLESEVHHNIDQTYTATQKAAEELKLHVITSDGGKDALSATIVARDAADKRITIKLKTVTQDITQVSIRVGTFGDKTKQHLIYDKIRDNLKAFDPQPAKTAPAAPSESPPQSPPDASSPQTAPAAPVAQAAQNSPNPPVSQEPAQTSGATSPAQPPQSPSSPPSSQ